MANGIKAKVFSKVYSGKDNESTDDLSGTGNTVLFLEAGTEHVGGSSFALALGLFCRGRLMDHILHVLAAELICLASSQHTDATRKSAQT